ncbi:MAG: preprotein translocase subunit SecE [Ectothiorhodospiraceae bacterium]|nr:preprotein translocase subunit SecE [Ectothiorhodospiraceae bacterium]
MKEKITNFVSDVIKEMKKVTWPTREELKDSTVVVLVSSVLISLFIFAVDWVLQQMMTLLLAG